MRRTNNSTGNVNSLDDTLEKECENVESFQSCAEKCQFWFTKEVIRVIRSNPSPEGKNLERRLVINEEILRICQRLDRYSIEPPPDPNPDPHVGSYGVVFFGLKEQNGIFEQPPPNSPVYGNYEQRKLYETTSTSALETSYANGDAHELREEHRGQNTSDLKVAMKFYGYTRY